MDLEKFLNLVQLCMSPLIFQFFIAVVHLLMLLPAFIINSILYALHRRRGVMPEEAKKLVGYRSYQEWFADLYAEIHGGREH